MRYLQNVSQNCGKRRNDKKKVILPILLFTVVVLSILSCQNTGTTQDYHVGDYKGSIVWDGLERSYLIHIPPSHVKSQQMPIVIALHGGGGTDKDMVKLTQGGFNTLADKEGFIVIYPEGAKYPRPIKTRWNDGRNKQFSQTDDVGFISTLIDHLAQTLNINQKRVYVTGISNGAHMAVRLAMELSNKITAVAPVAFSMQEKYLQWPAPQRPIPILIMTGTEDPFVPWEGGETPDSTGNRKLGKILPLSETVKYWVNQNQCYSTPTITYEPDRDPKDGIRVQRSI